MSCCDHPRFVINIYLTVRKECLCTTLREKCLPGGYGWGQLGGNKMTKHLSFLSCPSEMTTEQDVWSWSTHRKDLHKLFLSFRLLLLSSVLHTVIKFSTLTITASITTHMALRLYPWVADVITICHPINFPFKGNVMFGGKPTHTLVKAFSVVFTSRKCKLPFNFLALMPNQKSAGILEMLCMFPC